MLHVCSACDYNYPVGTDMPQTPIGIGITHTDRIDPRDGCRGGPLNHTASIGVIQAILF